MLNWNVLWVLYNRRGRHAYQADSEQNVSEFAHLESYMILLVQRVEVTLFYTNYFLNFFISVSHFKLRSGIGKQHYGEEIEEDRRLS